MGHRCMRQQATGHPPAAATKGWILLFSIQSGTTLPLHGMVPLTFRVGLPSHLNLSDQRGVS